MKQYKGDYGYFGRHRKYVILRTVAMFLLVIAVFTLGYVTTKTRLNLLTFVALLGSLPACKSVVEVFIAFGKESMPIESYEKIEQVSSNLVKGYDLFLTAYQQSAQLDCVVIHDGQILFFTTHKNVDGAFVEEHVKQSLSLSHIKASVKVMKEEKAFIERLKSWNEKPGDLEKDQGILLAVLALAI